MKTVVLYELADGAMDKAKLHFAAHREHMLAFHARGELLMSGPFSDPTQGAMGIFTNRKAADEFVSNDPFVLNGVVSKWLMKEWNEALFHS